MSNPKPTHRVELYQTVYTEGTDGEILGVPKEELVETFENVIMFQFGTNILQITSNDGSAEIVQLDAYSRIKTIPYENPFEHGNAELMGS